MKTVMVLTNVTGNEELDRQRAAEYCRFAAHKGNIPLSPYLCFHGVFKDELAGAVEGFLAERLVKNVDEVWVFGFEQGEARKKREKAVQKRYGQKGRYFCHPEIGRELLLCAMYSVVKVKTGNKTAAETYAGWYQSVYLPTPKTETSPEEGQG